MCFGQLVVAEMLPSMTSGFDNLIASTPAIATDMIEAVLDEAREGHVLKSVFLERFLACIQEVSASFVFRADG